MLQLMGHPVWSRRIFVLLLFLAVTSAYANHFHNPFHFDDSHTIVDNPNIRSLRNLPSFFTDPGTLSVQPRNRAWRPLVTTSLAIDYWLGNGLDPFWFQLSTYIWYLVLIGLVLILFQRLLDSVSKDTSNGVIALAGAALYGLHPACAETVNYINQRADVYSTLGVVAGLYLYAAKRGWRSYGIYLLPVAAGLLSKPPALVFPAFVFLYALLFEETGAVRALRAALPALSLSVFLGYVQAAMTPATFTPLIGSAAAYRLTQPYVALRYFVAFFVPIHLTADTDLSPVRRPFEPVALAGYLFLAAVVGAAWYFSRRRELRPAGFGLWWFLVALTPTSLFPLSEVENDHRMFFPFIGLSLATTWLLALSWRKLGARMPRAVPVAVALAVFAACGYGVQARNRVWRDDLSLWRDAAAKSPHNGRAWMNYGRTLMAQGDLQGALAAFEKGRPWAPSYDLLEVNLGVVTGALGRNAEAEAHFRRALALDPRDATPRVFYGRWLAQKGRPAEAEAQARAALDMNALEPGAGELLRSLQAQGGALAATPRTPEDWLDASLSYYQQQKYVESLTAAQNAANLRPGYAEAYNNIGAAYAALHLWDQAVKAEQEAIRLKPDYQLARNNLAWAMEQKRRGVR